MSPSTGVEPGQAVIANVRIENRGQKVQDTVKTIVEVPALNIRAESYVSNLGVATSRTSEDMYLGVPRDAQVCKKFTKSKIKPFMKKLFVP